MGPEGHEETEGGSHEEIAKFFSAIKRRRNQFQAEQSKVREYGTVMLWHRWVDENLTKAIKSQLRPLELPLKRLFRYPGGLSTFSARCHLGSLLGLYGSTTYGNLRLINDIRNEFAHPKSEPNPSGEFEILGFDHPGIAKMCLSLEFVYHQHADPKSKTESSAEEWYCLVTQSIARALALLAFVQPALPDGLID